MGAARRCVYHRYTVARDIHGDDIYSIISCSILINRRRSGQSGALRFNFARYCDGGRARIRGKDAVQAAS